MAIAVAPAFDFQRLHQAFSNPSFRRDVAQSGIITQIEYHGDSADLSLTAKHAPSVSTPQDQLEVDAMQVFYEAKYQNDQECAGCTSATNESDSDIDSVNDIHTSNADDADGTDDADDADADETKSNAATSNINASNSLTRFTITRHVAINWRKSAKSSGTPLRLLVEFPCVLMSTQNQAIEHEKVNLKINTTLKVIEFWGENSDNLQTVCVNDQNRTVVAFTVLRECEEQLEVRVCSIMLRLMLLFMLMLS